MEYERMIIELISKKYKSCIKLMDPVECIDINLPGSLKEILLSSNGVLETMPHPKTGETMDIGWIVYSYEEICRATAYYKKEYGLSGTVFSDDGAGNPYYIFQDKVYEFDPIDNESVLKADSLELFFAQP